MRKLITALCIVALSATVVQARPHGGFHHHDGRGGPTYHFAPRHHHHGRDVAAGLAIGLIGGSILNAAFAQPRTVTTTYSPVTYTPAVTYAPAVVSAPVVAPVAVSTTSPCYTTTNIVTGATTTNCSSTIVTGNYFIQ